jgi:hypothetical protein
MRKKTPIANIIKRINKIKNKPITQFMAVRPIESLPFISYLGIKYLIQEIRIPLKYNANKKYLLEITEYNKKAK